MPNMCSIGSVVFVWLSNIRTDKQTPPIIYILGLVQIFWSAKSIECVSQSLHISRRLTSKVYIRCCTMFRLLQACLEISHIPERITIAVCKDFIVVRFLKYLAGSHGLAAGSVHMIGHSLGSHTLAYACKNFTGIGRLTGACLLLMIVTFIKHY